MATEPLNIVPTATNIPSSRTAIAANVSSIAVELTNAPDLGAHFCRYDFCFLANPVGLAKAYKALHFSA